MNRYVTFLGIMIIQAEMVKANPLLLNSEDLFNQKTKVWHTQIMKPWSRIDKPLKGFEDCCSIQSNNASNSRNKIVERPIALYSRSILKKEQPKSRKGLKVKLNNVIGYNDGTEGRLKGSLVTFATKAAVDKEEKWFITLPIDSKRRRNKDNISHGGFREGILKHPGCLNYLKELKIRYST